MRKGRHANVLFNNQLDEDGCCINIFNIYREQLWTTNKQTKKEYSKGVVELSISDRQRTKTDFYSGRTSSNAP